MTTIVIQVTTKVNRPSTFIQFPELSSEIYFDEMFLDYDGESKVVAGPLFQSPDDSDLDNNDLSMLPDNFLPSVSALLDNNGPDSPLPGPSFVTSNQSMVESDDSDVALLALDEPDSSAITRRCSIRKCQASSRSLSSPSPQHFRHQTCQVRSENLATVGKNVSPKETNTAKNKIDAPKKCKDTNMKKSPINTKIQNEKIGKKVRNEKIEKKVQNKKIGKKAQKKKIGKKAQKKEVSWRCGTIDFGEPPGFLGPDFHDLPREQPL